MVHWLLKFYVSIREFKEEVGEGGDPYMQIVRLRPCGESPARKVRHNGSELFKTCALKFLLCVYGESITE
jgi:hypothetical protein